MEKTKTLKQLRYSGTINMNTSRYWCSKAFNMRGDCNMFLNIINKARQGCLSRRLFYCTNPDEIFVKILYILNFL
jgi:hypothetical protein